MGKPLFDFKGMGPFVGVLIFADVEQLQFRVLIMMVMMMSAILMIMVMIVVVVMGMMVIMDSRGFYVARGAPGHPSGGGQDDNARADLKVGLRRFDIEVPAKIKGKGGQQPDDQGMGKGGRDSEQARLQDRAANGDDESGHHGFRVARFQAVQGPEQNGAGQKKPDVGRALIQKRNDFIHSTRGISLLNKFVHGIMGMVGSDAVYPAVRPSRLTSWKGKV